MSYLNEFATFHAALDPQPEPEDRWAGWMAVAKIAAVCAFALALFVGPSDIRIAGANPQSFSAWYQESEENRFHYWYSSDPRNASYYHVREHFGHGGHGDFAMRVADCESGLNPRAHNPSGASGVFQVMPEWADEYRAVTGLPYYDERFNPDANALFAAWLVNETGGWSHWSCRP